MLKHEIKKKKNKQLLDFSKTHTKKKKNSNFLEFIFVYYLTFL